MDKTVLDISCESLDLYFAHHLDKITPEAKEKLPRDIAFKLFRRGGEWNSKSTSRLNFVSKIFVMLRALKRRFFLLIEDHENGIGIDQFLALRQTGEYRELTMEAAEKIGPVAMILANKELSDFFQYLNAVSTSPAYRYLMRNKNVPENRVDAANRQMEYIVRFLVAWEGRKKELVANIGLSIPEIFVMLCLFDGEEHAGGPIYKATFKRAYQSSPAKIRTAFCSLRDKGYITKYGSTKGSTLQITALGRDVLRQALQKYAVNF